jgi:hypothetical protein
MSMKSECVYAFIFINIDFIIYGMPLRDGCIYTFILFGINLMSSVEFYDRDIFGFERVCVIIAHTFSGSSGTTVFVVLAVF